MGLVSDAQWIALLVSPLIVFAVYVVWNDRRITTIPARALSFGPNRVTPEDTRRFHAKFTESPPLSSKEVLPEKTGRRYIVVGGGGFLGAWIATKLLERGEEYHNIRLLDINAPANYVVKEALSKGVQFIKTDVTDAQGLLAAFKAPWPESSSTNSDVEPEITVFHTAANIRFFERHPMFLDRSARVNITGTQNVIDASRAVGATVLVYTSSGSVGVFNTRLLLWPWETEPDKFVQVINDDDSRLPERHEDFFSNYAATKRDAERLVRSSDGLPTGDEGSGKVMRTGCLRPGNGVYGPRGDMLFGAYLVRQNNPSFAGSVIQSAVYVENCVAAHLCYEARLLEIISGSPNPDIGGKAFCIADPGPPTSFGDVYTTLETLSGGECHFPSLSPSMMLILAHGIEWYYRKHHALVKNGWKFAKYIPAVQGDIINLQPSLFYLVSVHLIFDDSRARLPPSKGGLGYEGVWTTIEGVHQTFLEHESGVGRSERRSDSAGVSFKFGLGKKTQVQAKVPDAVKVADAIPIIPHVEMNI